MFPMITEAEYRKQLNRIPGRAFLFFGDEDYLKGVALRLSREALCPDPSFAIFNDVTIDALDYTPEKLLDAMMPPPMMTEARLILLRGIDFTSFRDELDDLLEVLAQLADYDYNTVIIHVAAGLIEEGNISKKPSTIMKRFAEVATPVHFPAQTDARLAVWAGKHFEHLGVTAAPPLCAELIAYAGRSMFVLASEIEKLACYVKAKGRNTLERDDIYTVAAPNTVIDAFSFSNAILDGNSAKALEALSVMKFERRDPILILGEISSNLANIYRVRLLLDEGKTKPEIVSVLKLHDYKVGLLMRSAARTDATRLARILSLTAEADAAVKRTYNDYAPIERLISILS
ncbi:MAG: DNA polymerase III subunit delta [Ruminococcaceae bacterium]|nr:DNA polymerase III subunit delta [Oscillospiraceae bacterium]